MSAIALRPFLRSSVGKGFLVFALCCALMAVGIAILTYRSSLTWFQVNKGEEQITAAQLVDAFVATYADTRGKFMTSGAPVPASFRAQGVERFNHTRDSANALHLLWVGVPGREIATAPTDLEMGEAVKALASAANPVPVTRFVRVDERLFFRTINPVVAGQQACVDCHNQIQAGKTSWRLGEVMGASVLDVPATPFLDKATHDAVLTGLAVLLFSTVIGFVTFYLQYRQFARRAETEASLRQAHAEIQALNGVLEQRVEERTSELRDVQAELLRKERLAALGQLTATVSHELRNPLGVIRNTLYTVSEAATRNGLGLERPLARIDRSIMRCNDIIAKMLDFARPRDIDAEPRVFEGWLVEILGEYSAPSGIAIEPRLGAPGAEAAIDPRRLQQVFVNLLDNACDAIAAAQGEGQAPGPARITVATKIVNGRLEIVVEDTGAGIANEVLPKIFEPLFSTKSFGTGLGLPTVRQIVEQHGGAIEIASEPGHGTRATIRLPLLPAREAAA